MMEKHIKIYDDTVGPYRKAVEEAGLLDPSVEGVLYVYNSVAIEGNSFSYADTEELLYAGNVRPKKSFEDHLEVKDMWDAYHHVQWLIKEKKAADLSEEMIMDIHRFVLRRRKPDAAGVVKMYPNRNAYRHFPPILNSKILFKKAVDNFHVQRKKKVHPLVMAAGLHYDMWDAHLFQDGNKRTCRLVFLFVMRRYKAPELKFKMKGVDPYFKALRESWQQGDRNIFIKYSFEETTKQMKRFISLVGEMKKKVINGEGECAKKLLAVS